MERWIDERSMGLSIGSRIDSRGVESRCERERLEVDRVIEDTIEIRWRRREQRGRRCDGESRSDHATIIDSPCSSDREGEREREREREEREEKMPDSRDGVGAGLGFAR
jgi:hypothetical protein